MKARLSQLTLIAWACARAVPAAEPVVPASTHAYTNQAASGGSYLPAFSADGQHLVFVSHANNLVAQDNFAPHLDVFVRDLVGGALTLASVNTNGAGGGNADALMPSISSNGQFIAFASRASNLVPNDTNNASDVFLRDGVAGATQLISVGLDGGCPPATHRYATNAFSGNPRVSADGRWVYFESFASNLVTQADDNLAADVFARDTRTGRTILVSAATNGTASGNGASTLEDITPDGRFAVFISTANNLVLGVANARVEVYVRDLQEGRTAWASRGVASNYPATTYRCLDAVISANAAGVSFRTLNPTNAEMIFYHDLVSGATTRLAKNSLATSAPRISADGRYVVYETERLGTDDMNVFRWDRDTTNVVLVSARDGSSAFAADHSELGRPVMTPDANLVLFLSTATDLVVPRSSHWALRPFWRDVSNQVTRLVRIEDQRFGSHQTISYLTSQGGGTHSVPVDPLALDLQFSTLALHPDGGSFAFDSDQEAVPSDLNDAGDVYLHDFASGISRLVSARAPDYRDVTGTGATLLAPGALSADGRVLVFVSMDNLLTPDDTNRWGDLIVRDLVRGQSTRMDVLGTNFDPRDAGVRPVLSADGCLVVCARAPAGYSAGGLYRLAVESNAWAMVEAYPGTPQTYYPSRHPAVSSDGRLVAFDTLGAANWFVPAIGDANYGADVILRDFARPTNSPDCNRIISVNLAGTACGNGASELAQISSNAQWVLFQSLARDLVTNVTPANTVQFYARNLLLDATRLVSAAADGAGLPEHASNAVFSADARCVVFQSCFTLYRHWLGTDLPNEVLRSNACSPSTSADGRWVAFQQPRGTNLALSDVCVLDANAGAGAVPELISVNRLGIGPGNGASILPQISPDGRLVVFTSRASNLVGQDTNNAPDVFVRFRASGATLALSQSALGDRTGNGPSTEPVLSADGRTVAFMSFAADLVAGDYNSKRDVFIARLGGPDRDGDGLEDDWELAYFETLERDGSGDYDGDGQGDRAEWFAGTDPTNLGSVLRVWTVRPVETGSVTVRWSAAPGRAYRVQFKDAVSDPEWSELPDTITAAGAAGCAVDESAGPLTQRYYRVILVP